MLIVLIPFVGSILVALSIIAVNLYLNWINNPMD